MEHFPTLSIGDDVRAQERLLRERFGIGELALVVGGSMGAQQVYEWAVRFPDKVRRAGTDRRHGQDHPAQRDLRRSDYLRSRLSERLLLGL